MEWGTYSFNVAQAGHPTKPGQHWGAAEVAHQRRCRERQAGDDIDDTQRSTLLGWRRCERRSTQDAGLLITRQTTTRGLTQEGGEHLLPLHHPYFETPQRQFTLPHVHMAVQTKTHEARDAT